MLLFVSEVLPVGWMETGPFSLSKRQQILPIRSALGEEAKYPRALSLIMISVSFI